MPKLDAPILYPELYAAQCSASCRRKYLTDFSLELVQVFRQIDLIGSKMVLITEVTAIGILLLKAAEFSTQIRDGWYKGSAELDQFPTKVAILSTKHAQWTTLLEKFGEMENEHLRPLVKVADQLLDKEQKYVRRMQSSCVLRSTRRAFPGQLTHILNHLEMSVDAGCKMLESRVDTHDLLERQLEQTPYPLPFGPDSNYVPLVSSIAMVQEALEDANGRRVVTLHGRPGMGKSSLAKYLALHYQNAPKQHMVASSSTTQKWFPNGVFYLLCGQQARVDELQMDLLECLRGVGGSSVAKSNGSTSAPQQEREFVQVPHKEVMGRLRLRLAKQKVLIILDDVWEREVVESLLVPGEGVKYLITSQIRSIWNDATKVEIENPHIAQASQIMANYTEGLPTPGEFPSFIKSVTDEIIKELDYHPLSLANIGVTIDSDRATDAEGWKAVKRNLRDLLDENDLDYRPLVYQRSYPLTVDASMMLMVNSLPPGPKHLLFLIGLVGLNSSIPEVLVKTFVKFIQPTERRWLGYQNCMKYLKDRSLVELVHGVDADRIHLATHGLRTYYIRKKHMADMKSIATEILSGRSESNDHGGQLIQCCSTKETRALPTIMGAMYFDEPFKDLVVPELESQITIFNGGIIPQSISYEVDTRDVMGRAEHLRGLGSLVWLLNPDGEGGWKKQAHDYVTKIVIRLAFRKELDDESMAHLIQLPQTSTTASRALKFIIGEFGLGEAFHHAYLDQKITFSSEHWKTMESLLGLLHDYSATISTRVAAISPLMAFLDYETKDTILMVAKKCMALLAKDSNPYLQSGVATHLFCYGALSKAKILVGGFPKFLDHLFSLIVEGKYSWVQEEAGVGMVCLCKGSTFVSQTMAIPSSVNTLFKKFLLSSDQPKCSYRGGYLAGEVLSWLSCHPENRVQFMTISKGVEGLTKMLCKNAKSQTLSCPNYNMLNSTVAAEIVGNLSLVNEVRKFILDVNPKLEEALRVSQVSMSSLISNSTTYLGHITEGLVSISRLMTIMDPLEAKGTIAIIPPPHPQACFYVYMGRIRGFMEMEMYSDALATFNIFVDECPAHNKYSAWSTSSWWREFEHDFRPLGMFLKAMLKDYTGAMLNANRGVEEFHDLKKKHPNTWSKERGSIFRWMSLGERGVLKQMSRTDLNEALMDLDEALMDLDGTLTYFHYKWQQSTRTFWAYRSWHPNPHKLQYGCLKHRGLVKKMMGDEVGARIDAESALKLKLDLLVFKKTRDALGPIRLLDVPVKYLGFTL